MHDMTTKMLVDRKCRVFLSAMADSINRGICMHGSYTRVSAIIYLNTPHSEATI
jgi:hypothetical protein